MVIRPMSPRGRRMLGLFTAAITLLILIGVTYQGVSTAFERREFHRPGGLGDVGGLQLHIYCTGVGEPTVVLEAAAGSMSPAWGLIQADVARMTRVCSYDRAGLGWSETREGPYDPARVPSELRALLNEAREPGPFVLVGHELGAALSRLFAAQYPEDTAALVLIDDPTTATRPTDGRTMAVAWPWLARAGVLRLTGSLSQRAGGLPGQAGGAMRAFLNRPDHLTSAATEIARMDDVTAAAAASRLNRDIGVTSLSTASDGLPAMIVRDEDAQRVTAAIATTLGSVRQNRARSPRAW